MSDDTRAKADSADEFDGETTPAATTDETHAVDVVPAAHATSADAAGDYAADDYAAEDYAAGGHVDGQPVATDTPADPASDAQDPGPAAQPTVAAAADASVQYGVGPFSIREVALLGVWALSFVFSFFSIYVDSRFMMALGVGGSVWTSGISWILTIGAPTVAVGLIVLRRFSPDAIRRVGSLGIDQFASVAFSVAALIWLGILWEEIARVAQGGPWLHSWVVWVELVLMLAGVLLTVFARFIAPFDQDFQGRPQVTAHVLASPARPVVARPVTASPAADTSERWADPAAGAATATDTTATSVIEPLVAEPAASQAFWALAPVERDVVDENGVPLFTVGPTAWALVIEDRGDAFVVRHEDGRVGYLRDVSGVTRG
ncbi:SUR7/PalI family protein [Microbacterium sp. W1N]|uniref:SUR7/PalI family protein n=1 Tax=Microbacterium festucae TaxID=2977531 RepID=UPI0021C2084C|nr:SUR7/PalI family protein [Microbacterium festucae]MCT9819916.1 SUR7/PalI family protein [Microbacterium festucae]